MNRILFIIATAIAILVLSGVVFVAFFQYDTTPRAQAFVVVAPTSVMGATAIDTVTRTAATLAVTDIFHASFINDLTLSGTVFTEEDIAQTLIRQETPGLISVSVAADDVARAQRIATSGAYSVVRIIKEYYGTSSVYTFSIIDGAAVTMPPRISPALGALVSVLIGVLLTALIFAIVFSVRGRRAETTSLRPHGHIHASRAQLDLKLPESLTSAQTDAHTTTQQDENYDYMRDIYKDYDASLEELTEREASVEDAQEDVVATRDIQERITQQDMPEVSVIKESPVQEIPEETVKEKTVEKESIEQEKPVKKTVVKEKTEKKKSQNTVNTLSALGALFKGKEKEPIKEGASQKEETKHAAQTSQKSQKAKTSAPVITTHSAPANLPVMEMPKKPQKQTPSQKETSEDDAQKKDPTPAEVRKRLNELLSGKPPKISS